MPTDLLSWDNLTDAWNDVQRAGAGPGVDDVTVWRWGRHWEANLIALRAAVIGNTYKPAPLRRYTIPKRTGGVRHIASLTVTDKVLQRAALNVLDAMYDPTFLAYSYGYRRGRCAADAVLAVCQWRDAGYTNVLDADIDDCFGSLDHEVICHLLRRDVGDAMLLHLVDLWLEQGRLDPLQEVGIPLGAVISPFLCNLVLHQLDLALLRVGWQTVRYADDFVVLCHDDGEVREAYERGGDALAQLKLRYEPTKTAMTTFDHGFEYLGVRFEGDVCSYLWKDKRIVIDGDYPYDLLTHRLRYS